MNPKRWWDEQVLPRAVDVVLSDRTTAPWRARVAGGAVGEVLELGFGSGANLPYYPDDVCRVLAVEPADLAWSRAAENVSAFGRPVERVGLDAAVVDLPDETIDSVVATWVLCTVPDLEGALAEVARVLRPGGGFHLVEHSLAADPRVAGAQRRIQPAWGAVAGGCHLDRDIPAALERAGFDTGGLRSEYAVDLWPARPFGWFCSGRV